MAGALVSQSEVEPIDVAAKAAVVDLLNDLQREATREDLPQNLKKLTRYGDQQVSALLEAVLAGNKVGVEELILGTVRKDGTRRPDGLRQVLPYWARGTATLEALNGVVVVDETQDPVTVTIHWEQVPRCSSRGL